MINDFSIFFKKKNFFLISFCVINGIFVFGVAAIVLLTMNFDISTGNSANVF